MTGVSLKAYFGVARTRAYLAALAELDEELFVLPSFVSLPDARDILNGTRVAYGAQDVCEGSGAYTGEVTAGQLAELGCTYAEVGHAERRARYWETDELTARKAAAAAHAGLTPIVCISEPRQIDPVLRAVVGDLIFAYEPVWAIGAARPAPASYINKTAHALRERIGDRAQLLYGGSAGPGLFPQIAGAVDGLFLGRFAHDIANLKAVLAETSAAATCH